MANLKEKLFTAAAAYGPFTPLLGSAPLQWGDTQLPQKWNLTTLGAVIVFVVSNPPQYVLGGRLSSSFSRVQFTIYGHGNDSENADAIASALYDFLAQFNAYGLGTRLGNANANQVVNDRDSGIAQTNPLTYQRIIDAMIFNDESV